MLTSEPVLFSINIKPLCSESSNFPNLSGIEWRFPAKGASSLLPFSAVAMSFPTALYPSCTQLCWKHQFQCLQMCTLLRNLQPIWLDILIVGGIPKVSPRAGSRVTSAKVIYRHHPIQHGNSAQYRCVLSLLFKIRLFLRWGQNWSIP